MVVENWLTRKLNSNAWNITLVLVALLMFGSLIFLHQFFGAESWMPASYESVFKNHEYWRLWTTLFAHADPAHLLGNLFLFIPFAYFLTGYFGVLLFPLLGFVVGGLINALTLTTLSGASTLIGVSGVVHWMGATWVTLYLLIDQREPTQRRILKSIGASLILFIPTSFKPEISYLTHFLGYISGVISGAAFYFLNRKAFLAAVKFKIIKEEDEALPQADEEHFFDSTGMN